MTKIAILGAGNFGFALTYHLDRKNDPDLDIWLYARNSEQIDHIRETHTHPLYYPTIELAHTTPTSDLAAAVNDAEVIVLAVASTGLRPTLQNLQPLINHEAIVMSIMKALDQETGEPLSSVIATELAGLPVTIAALAGGTTGTALTQEQYLGATLACVDESKREFLREIFRSPYLHIQTSADVDGVEYAGSLKNLISVGVGLVKGLGFAYGTQTHTLSLLAAECEKYAVHHGAQTETFDFASQCWGNDMVMSSTDPETRNHQFGLLLGEGLRFSAALEKMTAEKKTAEAANTLAVLARQNFDLSEYPLLQFLVALQREEVGANEIVKIIETYP